MGDDTWPFPSWMDPGKTWYGRSMNAEIERMRHLNGNYSRKARELKAENEALKARITELEQVERRREAERG